MTSKSWLIVKENNNGVLEIIASGFKSEEEAKRVYNLLSKYGTNFVLYESIFV
jgi:hypothetical protein